MINFKTIEVSKLIQFGYELHEDGLVYRAKGTSYVPRYKYYDDSYPNNKRINNGVIFGFRGYANHTDNTVFTQLGVTVGEYLESGFKYYSSIFFETSNDYDVNDNNRVRISLLKPNLNKKHLHSFPIIESFPPDLEHDHDNLFREKTEDQQLNIFLDAMEIIGFLRSDVIALLHGEKTAEQVFMAVAPPELCKKRQVFFQRRIFIFEENTMVKGKLDSIPLDKFPFPFEGAAIIDCTKVNTTCVNFGINEKQHKLINVNSNPDSICYTNLRNAIIEEPIDLSIVKATRTKFGHHTIINFDKSITPLKSMDLMLAIDENGNGFIVDENGIVQLDEFGNPKTLNSTTSLKIKEANDGEKLTSDVEILANADNEAPVNIAIEKGADGIGLVRTEHMFFNNNDNLDFVELFIKSKYSEKYNEILEKCKQIQKSKAQAIFNNAKGKRVVFRLLDAKLNEFLRMEQQKEYNKHYSRNTNESRGAALLLDFPQVLEMQAQAIIEAAIESDVTTDFLVPLITDAFQFSEIKMIIDEVAKEKKFNNYRIGAMIENVAMANDADILAKEADFISFGTNDLTESVTGLPRNSNRDEFSVLCTEVMDVIKEGIYRARVSKHDIRIGICGDHSSYLDNIVFFSELDIDYISCNVNFIPTAKLIFAQNKKSNSKSTDLFKRSLLRNEDIKE